MRILRFLKFFMESATTTEFGADIFADPREAFAYVERIGRPMKSAEEKIKTNPVLAYKYAKMFKMRFEQAEPHIMKHPEAAYYYARFILKKRWLEAETFIKRNAESWNRYKQWLQSRL